MPDILIETYEEACQLIEQWGIVPLSTFIPEHPSLDAVTRPEAWHTGAITDPWLWRDRLASAGMAAYGRFIGGRPLLVSREIFPLLQCLLDPGEPLEERYAAGRLARSTVRLYELISENAGIDVKALRRLANMQDKADKSEFDRSLIDLQSSADIVISGISSRLNAQGNKSGWNSTCYMLSQYWMEQHDIAPLNLTQAEARSRLFAWIEQRWDVKAINFLRKKLG